MVRTVLLALASLVGTKAKSHPGDYMRITILISRFLLGMGFIIFGLNILHPFMTSPPPPQGSLAAQFVAVMVPSHWIELVGVLQLLGGLMLIIGRTAPLGLVVLGPILVNILAFHIFLQGGQGIAPGLVFSILEIFLIYAYRSYFRAIVTANALPT
jgi:putative oxidoreductase